MGKKLKGMLGIMSKGPLLDIQHGTLGKDAGRNNNSLGRIQNSFFVAQGCAKP
jgi:hypothetical protein